MKQTKTPECDKALKVQDESHKIGQFLDWLQGQSIQLCSPHSHTEYCYTSSNKYADCGYTAGDLIPIREPFEKLLARYFNIDLTKVEKEKRAILDALRKSGKYQ